MKPLRLIYNPLSGDQNFIYSMDPVVAELQGAGYDVRLFRVGDGSDVEDLFKDDRDYDAVVVSGGDGTVNRVVNAMLPTGKSAPIGVIPSGTANDFAAFLGLPTDPIEAAKVVAGGVTAPCDAGRANGRYFVNVLELGALANISQSVDSAVKSVLGKLAYYMKGLEQLPTLQPFPVEITTSGGVLSEEIYIMVALNSSGAGGFSFLAPDASINDGLFDFVALKSCPFMDLAALAVKFLRRDFLTDPNILYFRDSSVTIKPKFDNKTFYVTDIDGEEGPLLPVEIVNEHRKLNFFVP